MKREFAFASVLLLAACASSGSSTTAPATVVPSLPTPAQIRQNAQSALYLLQAVGCGVAAAGQAAAPIVEIAADAAGNQVLSTVDSVSGKVCGATVPPSALPAPVPANSAPAAVAVPTS